MKFEFNGSSDGALLLRCTDHGILPHKHHSSNITITSQAPAYLVHLLRTYIVDRNNEDGFVLLKQVLQLVEVGCFVGGLSPHVCFNIQTGYLRVKRN